MADLRRRQQGDAKIQAYDMHQAVADIARQLSNLRMETRLQRDDDLHSSSILPVEPARMASI